MSSIPRRDLLARAKSLAQTYGELHGYIASEPKEAKQALENDDASNVTIVVAAPLELAAVS